MTINVSTGGERPQAALLSFRLLSAARIPRPGEPLCKKHPCNTVSRLPASKVAARWRARSCPFQTMKR